MTNQVETNSALSSKAVDFLDSQLIQVDFERFKAFKERATVNLAPITVIAGVNSGGKTTILQSLLLVRQSLITPYRSPIEDALKYNGELVRFLAFNELIFGKPKDDEEGFRLGFTFRINKNDLFLQEARRHFVGVVDLDGIKEPIIDIELQVAYDNAQRIVRIKQIKLSASSYHEGAEHQGPSLIFEPEGNQWRISYKWNEASFSIVSDGITLDRFIPVWRENGLKLQQGATAPSKEEEHKIRPDIYNVYRLIFAPTFLLLRQEIEERLFYVGPLRSAPQRAYLRQRVVGLDVGASGEYTIQLLHERREEQVVFVDLPPEIEDFNPIQLTPKTMTLMHAVQEALRLLGMEQALKTKKLGESFFEASFSLHQRPQTFVSIGEVGFGVSQILPIIAICLLSPPRSILIFEQPEIHLHPRAQAGLAELFLCMSCTNRRVVVETHSDHLINRLRRRVAEDKSSKTENKINILFVHPPTSQEEARQRIGAIIEQGRIDRYGDIENWPQGFLAESAKDARAIILARSAKRREEKVTAR